MVISTKSGGVTPPIRFIKVGVLCVICVLGLFGCSQLLCDFGISDRCQTYRVIYVANGADEGSVPVDFGEYQEGEAVTALANIGGLVRSGYSFDGWNTAANGAGVSYIVGLTFKMASADGTLHAQRSEDNEEGIGSDAYEPDNEPYQDGELIPDGQTQDGHTFTEGDEDWYYITANLGSGETTALKVETFGDTDTFLSVYDEGDSGIAYDDNSGDVRNALIRVSIDNSGSYLVLARHYLEDDGTGEYAIAA